MSHGGFAKILLRFGWGVRIGPSTSHGGGGMSQYGIPMGPYCIFPNPPMGPNGHTLHFSLTRLCLEGFLLSFLEGWFYDSGAGILDSGAGIYDSGAGI